MHHYNPVANVFKLENLSTHDGPGFRTVVFLKGCPLSCVWCHNPESLSKNNEIWHITGRCIHCNICVSVCKREAIKFNQETWELHREKCVGCYECYENCPTNAIESIGKKYTVNELIDEIIVNKIFWDTSGGGVTITGGEPLLYHEFVFSVFSKLKELDVHTALDTSLFTSETILKKISTKTDLFLADIKILNNNLHRQYTQVDNTEILKNIEYLSHLQNFNGKIWIRTPLIPNYTNNEENINSIYEFLEYKLGKNIEKWELLNFNGSCESKYKKLNKPWKLENAKLNDNCLNLIKQNLKSSEKMEILTIGF